MERYIIACRFGHAFVCRAWVSKSKARPGRRYGICKNWRSLEAAAIAEVQQRAGAWPVRGFFCCSPALAGGAVYIMGGIPRTRAKRMIAELDASRQQRLALRPIEAGDIDIFAFRYGASISYQVWQFFGVPLDYWKRAENWRALRPAARAAFSARYGDAPLQHDISIPCPPELAALARWPGE